MRWLIRNTDDQRRLRAVVGSGASRSSTAWMSAQFRFARALEPVRDAVLVAGRRGQFGGTSIDIR